MLRDVSAPKCALWSSVNRIGSLKVDGELVTTKSADLTATVSSKVAALAKDAILTYNGTTPTTANGNPVNVTLPNGQTQVITDTTSDSQCTIYQASVDACGSDYRCALDANTGNPKCVAIERKDDFDLIVGLGVGIPLFFIAVLIIAIVCIYQKRVKRNSKNLDHDDLDRTHDHNGFFSAGITPKFSTWGQPPYYSPSGWEDESTGSDDTNGSRRKRGRGDQFDMYHGKDYYVYDNGAMSNFSWDFMYQYVDPSEAYKIKRPTPEYTPNPVFVKKDQAPTSMA